MHILVVTLGTRGDFELFLALSRELRARGHRVVLASSGFYSAAALEAGLEWAPVGSGTQGDLVFILRSLSSLQDRTQRTHAYYRKWLRPQMSVSMDRITSLAAAADYFVSNLKLVLQRDGEIVPGAAVTYDPPGSVEDLPRYGTQEHRGRILDLVALNKGLVDPQDAWGPHYRFTGFWAAEAASAWSPAPELADFMSHGPPPVAVTMGSMVMFDSRRLVRLLARALGLAGQRAVLVGGWSGISPADIADGRIHCVAEIPYGWLFPRASCVIHHGGCGTVAAVLRSGRPSIVLPQVACQELFAGMLVRESLATGVFDAHSLRPEELAGAMRTAVADEAPKDSARRWQKTVAEDRGVAAAADWIQAHWDGLRRQEAGA